MQPAPTHARLEGSLRRLGRARRTRRRYRRARRAHWILLAVLLVLAFLWRAGLPLPVFGWLATHPWLAAGAVLGLYLLGPLIAWGALRLMSIDVEATARDVDDRHGFRDETSTALDLQDGSAGLGTLLVAQAQGRVLDLAAKAHGRRGRVSSWPARILSFLLLFVLLAPGVRGTWFGEAAGRGDEGLVGIRDIETAGRGLDAFSDDQWLSVFVEDPAEVEMLPPDPAPGDRGSADREDDK